MKKNTFYALLFIAVLLSDAILTSCNRQQQKPPKFTDKKLDLPEEIDLATAGDQLRVYKVTKDSIYLEFNN